MPPTFRRDWEYAARKDVFDSRLFVQNMPMPLSEISVTDPRHPVKFTVVDIYLNQKFSSQVRLRAGQLFAQIAVKISHCS